LRNPDADDGSTELDQGLPKAVIPMAGQVLRLRHRDVVRAAGTIDLLDVLSWELTQRTTEAPDRTWTSRFVPDHTETNAHELTAVRNVETGQVCLIPTPSLQMIGLAGLAALAGRLLMPPGPVTAAVFGSGATAQLFLGVLAEYVPNLRHAKVVQPAGARPGPSVEPRLRERLDRAGIGLSVVTDVRDGTEDANLLIVAELGRERPDIGRLPVHGLAVNAARRDLPDDVLAQADRIYVDDLTLLEHNQHRTFVRSHLAGAAARVGQPDEQQDSAAGRHRDQRVATDLGHLLARERARPNTDEVLLVELLGGGLLDVTLGRHIHRAAIGLGLGLPAINGEGD
jgi:ornithine cyclodeaminase/alanine dehydrogenase-like protein (mu-crystallin family)